MTSEVIAPALILVENGSPFPGTMSLCLFSALVLVVFTTLFWPQFVLFRQTMLNHLHNILLFTAKYL